MSLSVQEASAWVYPVRTRMPFRYGIATLTECPHAFVRVSLRIEGRRHRGIAADHLPPKWFTKDPQADPQQEIRDMKRVILAACEAVRRLGACSSVFELWWKLYQKQADWAEALGLPPLLWHFGVSLVERAAIDAFCRARQVSFARAVRSEALGLDLGRIHADLIAQSPAELLPGEPLRRVLIRHTVGLSDPLTDEQIPPDQRLSDGLPQSLAGCIRAYGLSRFKIKVSGDLQPDIERLIQVFDVIEAYCEDYAFSLDGNESFHDLEAFSDFWRALSDEPRLGGALENLLFVEQPMHRSVALSDEVQDGLLVWEDRPPILIDESDGQLTSLPRALSCGYAGTSHKNCKGVFKGLANACLIEHHRRVSPWSGYRLSAEDLSNIGPVALSQDLAVVASLGLGHVERNGHHYFRGLSMMPESIQRLVVSHHGDLYRQHEAGFPTLDIRGGRIELGSVVEAPFGVGFDPEPEGFAQPMEP